MKGIKKLLMGVLASAMAFTMVLSNGNAAQVQAEEGGKIIIQEAIAGQTYDVYRLFDYIPTSIDDEGNAAKTGVYKLSTKFSGFESEYFEVNSDNDNILTFKGDLALRDANGKPTDKAESAAAKLGQAALKFAKDNQMKYDASGEAKVTNTVKAGEKTTVEIPVTGFGYYVVDSSLGTAVSIDTNTPTATIKEKNSVPDLNKKITNAKNKITITSDGTGNNAQIGDTVNFEITANFKANGENYKIQDIVTKGLTLDLDSITVAFSDNVTMKYKKKGIEKEVTVGETTEKRKGFELEFEEVPAKDKTVTVTYSATVNKDAEISTSTNVNEAYIIYGHDAETTHKTTTTKTYPLQVKKIALGTENEKNPAILAGAEFELYRKLDNTKLSFIKESEDDEVYRVVPAGTEESTTKITTVKDKPFTINGLNTEDYIIVETKAPSGYNLLESKVIVGEGQESKEYKHAQLVTIKDTSTTTAPQVELVKDGSGLTLPSTGGIGTTIFYIIGGILIIAGVAYFIVRRKAEA